MAAIGWAAPEVDAAYRAEEDAVDELRLARVRLLPQTRPVEGAPLEPDVAEGGELRESSAAEHAIAKDGLRPRGAVPSCPPMPVPVLPIDSCSKTAPEKSQPSNSLPKATKQGKRIAVKSTLTKRARSKITSVTPAGNGNR
ncbi:hypothetical protein ACFQ0B_45075 [Nonomuraea thailandensis]